MRGKEGTGGDSVCNSPRWCEAMRCDRSAMSCGRPDGPAAVPAAQLSTPTMSIPDPVTAYVLIPASNHHEYPSRAFEALNFANFNIMAGKKRKDRRR